LKNDFGPKTAGPLPRGHHPQRLGFLAARRIDASRSDAILSALAFHPPVEHFTHQALTKRNERIKNYGT
jgi:hypothetical protein